MPIKEKKIVVTGGAGFIGSHVVDALLKAGAQVIVIDDFSTGKKSNITHVKNKITLIEGDINDLKLLKKTFKGAYGVIHLAAIPSVPKSVAMPLETHQANSTGTLSVLEAARAAQVDRVISATSSSVFGETAQLPKIESMTLDPLSPYAVQKLTGELYAKIYHSLYGLKTIGLRYFNVFGPRQDPRSTYAAVIPKFIASMKAGKKPVIFGDGKQTRDFTYVANVVAANILALEARSGFGEVYNIAAGIRVSLNDLVQRIQSELGTSVKAEYGQARPGEIKDSYADISKAKKILNYVPCVDFDEGLKRTIESFDRRHVA